MAAMDDEIPTKPEHTQESKADRGLKTTQEEFTAAVSGELEYLVFNGRKRDLSTVYLLKRMTGDFKIPTMEEIKLVQKNMKFLKREEVVMALVIREEMRKLKAAGLRIQEAAMTLTTRVKTDSGSFNELELSLLWERIINPEGFRKRETDDIKKDNETNDDKVKGKKRTKKQKKSKRREDGGRELVQMDEIFNRKQHILSESSPTAVRRGRKSPEVHNVAADASNILDEQSVVSSPAILEVGSQSTSSSVDPRQLRRSRRRRNPSATQSASPSESKRRRV